LDKPDPKTGKSRLQVLIEIRTQTKVVAPELINMVPVPIEIEYLWDWYLDLANARTAGFSVNALTWSDIRAYFTLLKISPEPWEVRTIRDIDAAFLASRADNTSGTVKNAKALLTRTTLKKRHG
jgi:hypothetical protein